jgi:hypothetical protein
MFAGIRFLWNATRGHRLQPWKSEYVRWRIETYSGLHADEVNGRVFFRFLMRERYRLVHFLLWTAKVDRATRA